MQLLFISGQEIIFILLIVVLLFGAKRLPEIAKGLGKGVNEFKRAADEIKSEITSSSEELKSPTTQIKDEFDELNDSIKR